MPAVGVIYFADNTAAELFIIFLVGDNVLFFFFVRISKIALSYIGGTSPTRHKWSPDGFLKV